MVGFADGMNVGPQVGMLVVGSVVGSEDDGISLGKYEGVVVGRVDGANEGTTVGQELVGNRVGMDVVGPSVGSDVEGTLVGK